MIAANIFRSSSESMIESFVNMLSDAKELLAKGATGADGMFPEGSFTGFINDTSGIIRGVALGVMGILFCIELIQNVLMKGENFQYTDVVACLIKLLLAKAMMAYTADIMAALVYKGNQLILGISSTSALDDESLKQNLLSAFTGGYADDSKIKTMISNIGLFATRLLALVVMQVCGIIVIVMAAVRIIEITFLTMLSPIAFCFVPYKETSNITVRFITNFFAVVLQGFTMVASFALYSHLVTKFLGSHGVKYDETTKEIISSSVMTAEDGWILLMYTVILIMCISFSGKWAKTAMGVS